MVLESTIVCVDNSEYMRNGDYIPNRLQAQNEAVNLICMSKTRSNPENNVGLVTLSNGRVLVTLTNEVGKVLANLHQVQPQGMINFETGIRVAHLALKHRQGRNHKMRIVAFIGSPVVEGEKDLIRIAKRLKKEKVNVDVVAFGQEGENLDKLGKFVETLNGKDGSGSHLVSIPPGPALADVLRDSPVVQGEDGGAAVGGGFEFGMDPNEDPELALALRVSMEEQRARQEAEQRQNAVGGGSNVTIANANNVMEESSAALFANVAQEALTQPNPDPETSLAAMTEEEQLAYAMQMSLRELENAGNKDKQDDNAMDTDDQDSAGSK